MQKAGHMCCPYKFSDLLSSLGMLIMKYSIAALMLRLSIFSKAARALPLDVTLLVNSSGSITIDDYETLME